MRLRQLSGDILHRQEVFGHRLGCGEAGAIGSPPAVINAVLNALSDYNVDNLQMPATPERVWQAMQAGS